MYYFDYASTTMPDDRILEIYNKISKEYFFHPQFDIKTQKIQQASENLILKALNLGQDKYEVVYTSGATEANNLATIGYAKTFTSPKHFITSKVEHSSMYNSFLEIEKLGHKVTYLNTKENGKVDLNDLISSLTPNTVMVSIISVNNESGVYQEVHEAYNIVKEYNDKIVFLTDAVQAIGKKKLVYDMFDMITLSGHKIYAPKAIGAVIKKKKINLKNIIYGGISENKYRAGTQSLALEVSFAYALKQAMEEIEDTTKKLEQYTSRVVKGLDTRIKINAAEQYGIISLTLPTKALGETLVSLFKKQGIIISTRSACSVKSNKPSRTLLAMGKSVNDIDRTIRISFSSKTTNEEVDYLISNINNISKLY